MIKKLITALYAAIFTLFAFWLIGLLWFGLNVSVLEPNEPDAVTDAIIVLTGGKNRVEEGLKLLQNDRAERLFISGVHEDVKPSDLIQNKKDASCCVVLGYKASDTVGNGIESAQWIKENDIESIRLVTSNYHMSRSVLIFRHHVPHVDIIRHPIKPENFPTWSKKFWMTAFSEYNKTLATWIKLSLSQKPSS